MSTAPPTDRIPPLDPIPPPATPLGSEPAPGVEAHAWIRRGGAVEVIELPLVALPEPDPDEEPTQGG